MPEAARARSRTKYIMPLATEISHTSAGSHRFSASTAGVAASLHWLSVVAIESGGGRNSAVAVTIVTRLDDFGGTSSGRLNTAPAHAVFVLWEPDDRSPEDGPSTLTLSAMCCK